MHSPSLLPTNPLNPPPFPLSSLCPGFDSDSAGQQQFVRVGYDMRQQHHQQQRHHHPRSANQRPALIPAAAAADLMTQSLIDWPDDETSPSAASSLHSRSHHHHAQQQQHHHHQQQQQQRICRRMKAVQLTDSGLVLSPQDAASLPAYPQGRRYFVSASSSQKTSPGEMPGYFFQSQVSCPPHLGGKCAPEDAIWAEAGPGVFEYQTAPAQAYPGQAYMFWPPHSQHIMGGRRRRHHQASHHSTQPIIVPATDAPFQVEKRSLSTKGGAVVGHNGRPQVLVTGRQGSKRGQDLDSLASLPIEEQP